MHPKTSRSQYDTIISYMEKNGDISRPGGGPAGRLQNLKQWHELVEALNADPSGIVKPHHKWRVTWSDMKCYTKKKYRKYEHAQTQPKWNDMEMKILPFICGPSNNCSEGDSIKIETQDSDMQHDPTHTWVLVSESEDDYKDDGLSAPPEDSAQPENAVIPDDSAPDSPISVSPSPSLDPGNTSQSPHPQQSNTKNYSIVDALLELNKLTRENESNRDRMMYKLEKNRLRQRDVELKLQAQWLSFFNGALGAVDSYLQASKNST